MDVTVPVTAECVGEEYSSSYNLIEVASGLEIRVRWVSSRPKEGYLEVVGCEGRQVRRGWNLR